MARDVPTRRSKSILALVFGADLGAAMVVAAVLEPSFTPVFYSLGLEARPVRYGVLVAVTVLAVVVGQFEYTRRALLTAVDGTPASAETHPDLIERAERLADDAGVRTPTVVVVRTAVPNSFTLSGYRSGTVVVSTGLIAILPGEELEAVLAHELAHLRSGDAFVMTMSSFLPTALSREYSPFVDPPSYLEEGLVAVGLFVTWYLLTAPFFEASLFAPETALTFVLVVAVVVLAGTLALGVLATVIGFLRQFFSFRREFAADVHAAELTSPDAMANALEVLGDATDGMTVQHDDLEALFFLPHGFSTPEANGSGVSRAYTHPSIEERRERVTALEGE